jgi:hypothetical protein
MHVFRHRRYNFPYSQFVIYIQYHQYNWPPRYNWNIVESGVKHQNLTSPAQCQYITNWYCELQNIRESSSCCLNEIIFPYLKINLYLKIIKTYLKDNVLYDYSFTCFNMIIYMVGNNRGSWCSLKKSCRFFIHFVINVKSWNRTPERFWHCAGLVKFWCLTPLSDTVGVKPLI